MPTNAGAPALSDEQVRKEWDEALLAALMPAPSLYERAEALDMELSKIESSLRAAMAINRASPDSSMRRIICLRNTLDLLCFLERHKTDPVLSKRIRELKKAEERG